MKKTYIYYCVIAALVFLGCEEILFEEDLSDAEVVLVAPSDGVQVENTSVTFTWDEVNQALSYRLQLAKPSFENESFSFSSSSIGGILVIE